MKPIKLSSEQIAKLQDGERVYEDGWPVRMEETGPRKFLTDVAEDISNDADVDSFVSETRFCIEDEDEDGNDRWLAGVNISGTWVVGRIRQVSTVVESSGGFTPSKTETFAKAIVFVGEPDISPADTAEFRDTLHKWMNEFWADDEVYTARYGGPRHNFEDELDDVRQFGSD